ncbi:hypothetical protein G7Y89_g15716 [Cudoniella acicularis]|uniref:Nucleoporin NUP53 n=1 Tax=Cudoniella acicularis TaxID=354080 RepID=A0A8H4QG82_9HELO|nr:hypothetical protein G7Y89_g15716 [Cudoniella acicularis]
MPPLILHNVPDEELYVGEDGIQRPYAMLFPGNEGNPSVSRARKTVAETGSFGKSTRRSRSRTGTPAAKREDPTLAAADAIFSNFLTSRATAPTEPQRKSSLPSASQPNISSSGPLAQIDGNAATTPRYIHKEPTEVILRGFRSTQQYAAIREYERVGGRICEDYPRDPPVEQRRYKSDLRDPATLRTQPLTAEEKAKANRFAGGSHWIKITFESAEGAEAAVDASPLTILGHLVHAELYRGVPPTNDEEIPATGAKRGTKTVGAAAGQSSIFGAPRQSSTLPRSFTTPSMSQIGRGTSNNSPTSSLSSSRTLDTATLSTSTGTVSSGTITAQTSSSQPQDPSAQIFCQRIPTAKKAKLLPAEQALLPQKSYWQRAAGQIPFLGWFSGDVIGTQVPRLDNGEFDWNKASMYWRVVYYIDCCTGWFEVAGPEKED